MRVSMLSPMMLDRLVPARTDSEVYTRPRLDKAARHEKC